MALALAEAGADIVVTYHSQAKAAAETVQGVEALARELAPFHITVNAVAPGIIATETTERTFSSGMLDVYTRYQVPLGRLGQPEEVAGLVVFLASAEARYITGQVYAVDGGFTMQ
jgi:NAD(P)-dependent dehydrogenase (short-subunit alcohol dehydrogenase family)